MHITRTDRPERGVIIVELTGSLTFSESGGAVNRFVQQQLNAGQAHFLVDLAGITEVDSFGVGELMSAVASARGAGGQLKLLYPGKVTQILLGAPSLVKALEVFDDEAEALRTFPAPFDQSTVRSEYFVG
jgi:anti-sigma B factor antagonist